MQQNGSAAGPEYLAPWLTYLASPTFRLFILISACREMSPLEQTLRMQQLILHGIYQLGFRNQEDYLYLRLGH